MYQKKVEIISKCRWLSMSKYLDLELLEIHNLLKNGKITPTDLVLEAFERVEEKKELNCFVTLDKEGALQRAKELEKEEIKGITYGIPIAIKDNIITKNLRTTASSKMLENFIPIYDADVVRKVKEAQMIVIGKTNMDEFAMGSSTQTSYFGPTKNPWNQNLVPGGSSGGSATVVSSRIVPLALGTDTGGSIRQPSSFCGIVGLKPTYGRVSRYGVIAFASSLDQVGPMTRTVYENAVVLNSICGKSDLDLTSVETKEDFTRLIGKDIHGMKLAIPKFYISDAIDSEIRENLQKVVSFLEKQGCTISYVDIDYIEQAVTLYQIIAMGEASSNLARYDGIRYGYRYENPKDMNDLYVKSRRFGFGDEVKRRIMVGSYLLSGENATTYYNKALEIRNEMKNSFQNVFREYDLIIGPTATTKAYSLGKDLDDAVKSFMDDILTIPVNMAGLPGMNLPIGFSNDHLPIGMQIIGNHFEEAKIYQLASFIEKELHLNLNPNEGDTNV